LISSPYHAPDCLPGRQIPISRFQIPLVPPSTSTSSTYLPMLQAPCVKPHLGHPLPLARSSPCFILTLGPVVHLVLPSCCMAHVVLQPSIPSSMKPCGQPRLQPSLLFLSTLLGPAL
jgi:hypothetical protein